MWWQLPQSCVQIGETRCGLDHTEKVEVTKLQSTYDISPKNGIYWLSNNSYDKGLGKNSGGFRVGLLCR